MEKQTWMTQSKAVVETFASNAKKTVIPSPLQPRLFASPLETFHLLALGVIKEFSMQDLLRYKDLLLSHIETSYCKRVDKENAFHELWANIIEAPHKVHEFLASRKKEPETKPQLPRKCPPLELSRLSWNNSKIERKKIEKDLVEQQVYYNSFTLLPKYVRSREELLITEKGVKELVSYICPMFENNDKPFVNLLLVSGKPGIGKKTLIRYIVRDVMEASTKIELEFFSCAQLQDPLALLQHQSLEGKQIRTNPRILVLYECDFGDQTVTKALQKLLALYKDKKSNLGRKVHQCLVILCVSNTAQKPFRDLAMQERGRKSTCRHIKLFAKPSFEFRRLFGKLAQKVRRDYDQIVLTPPEHDVYERRDVTMLLHTFSFLWISSDAGTAPSKSTVEQVTDLTLYHLIGDILLSRNVPYDIRRAYDLLPDLPFEDRIMSLANRSITFTGDRDRSLFSLMFLYNLWPYALQSHSAKKFYSQLFRNREVQQERGNCALLIQSLEKCLAYWEYKSYVTEPELYLFRDLLTVIQEQKSHEPLQKKANFELEYCKIRSEMKSERKRARELVENWLYSLDTERRIQLASLSTEQLLLYYEPEIRMPKKSKIAEPPTPRTLLTPSEKETYSPPEKKDSNMAEKEKQKPKKRKDFSTPKKPTSTKKQKLVQELIKGSYKKL